MFFCSKDKEILRSSVVIKLNICLSFLNKVDFPLCEVPSKKDIKIFEIENNIL